jgi:DNA-binding transcriptional ArsR family regulator
MMLLAKKVLKVFAFLKFFLYLCLKRFMTNIDFIIQLSDIVEKYKIRKIGKELASSLLEALNEEAKTSNIDLEVEYDILDEALNIVYDEEYIEEEEFEDNDDFYEDDY